MKTCLSPTLPRRRGVTKARGRRADELRVQHRATLDALPAGIERETMIPRWQIADIVCNEACIFMTTEIPARYIEWLVAMAERCYKQNPVFRERLRSGGNVGRDSLYACMRHWLAWFLRLERPDLYCCLTPEFCNGLPFPDGQHPRINRMGYHPRHIPPPLDWDASRVTRHERWAWLKGVALADRSEFFHPHG